MGESINFSCTRETNVISDAFPDKKISVLTLLEYRKHWQSENSGLVWTPHQFFNRYSCSLNRKWMLPCLRFWIHFLSNKSWVGHRSTTLWCYVKQPNSYGSVRSRVFAHLLTVKLDRISKNKLPYFCKKRNQTKKKTKTK